MLAIGRRFYLEPTFLRGILPDRGYAVGTIVNVEVDLLARYLERLLARDGDDISIDFLKAHGYA